MRKTLVGLFTLVALAVGIQVTHAACPCADPCPCPVVAPCQTPCAPACDTCCPAAPVSSDPCACVKGPCKKCTWWKIFEDKTCCYKTNAECDSCFSAKRAHWYKFWTDRCVVKNTKCADKCSCGCCD